MDPNLSGSCSQGCHKKSDHGAASGKGAESRQERGNHHPNSGVLHAQHEVSNLRPSLAQLVKGMVQLGVEHND
jgi:hypothetical protein